MYSVTSRSKAPHYRHYSSPILHYLSIILLHDLCACPLGGRAFCWLLHDSCSVSTYESIGRLRLKSFKLLGVKKISIKAKNYLCAPHIGFRGTPEMTGEDAYIHHMHHNYFTRGPCCVRDKHSATHTQQNLLTHSTYTGAENPFFPPHIMISAIKRPRTSFLLATWTVTIFCIILPSGTAPHPRRRTDTPASGANGQMMLQRYQSY